MDLPEIGETITNQGLVKEFQCGNMSGMRRSHKTNTLVIISDQTKELYDDRWNGEILFYTGMGKSGDQDLAFMQNKTAALKGEKGDSFLPFLLLYRCGKDRGERGTWYVLRGTRCA